MGNGVYASELYVQVALFVNNSLNSEEQWQ